MTIQRTANLNGICYEVAILEPPVVGQLETTVEQVGNWKEKDCYVVERQTAYGEAIARIFESIEDTRIVRYIFRYWHQAIIPQIPPE